MKKNVGIRIWLTEEQKRLIKARAEQWSMNLSCYCTYILVNVQPIPLFVEFPRKSPYYVPRPFKSKKLKKREKNG